MKDLCEIAHFPAVEQFCGSSNGDHPHPRPRPRILPEQQQLDVGQTNRRQLLANLHSRFTESRQQQPIE